MASKEDTVIPYQLTQLWALQAELSELECARDFILSEHSNFSQELRRVEGVIGREERTRGTVACGFVEPRKELLDHIVRLGVASRGWAMRIYYKKKEIKEMKKQVVDMGLSDFDFYPSSEDEDDFVAIDEGQNNYAPVDREVLVAHEESYEEEDSDEEDEDQPLAEADNGEQSTGANTQGQLGNACVDEAQITLGEQDVIFVRDPEPTSGEPLLLEVHISELVLLDSTDDDAEFK